MSTIAELIVDARVQSTGVKRGMDDLVNSVVGGNARINASTTQTFNAFASGGARANRAMTATAFGFESFIRSAQAGESGLTRAGRSLSMFALSFGPEGVLVASLILGGIALKDWWSAREKEAEDATKKVQASLAEMGRAFDLAGLRNQQHLLNAGDPFATTEGKRDNETDIGFTARRVGLDNFRKSVQGLQTEIVLAQEKLDHLAGEPGATGQLAIFDSPISQAARHVAALKDLLKGMPDELNRLDAIAAQLDPLSALSKAAHPVEELTDRVERLQTAMKQLLAEGIMPTRDMIAQLNLAHSDAASLLAKQADKYSKDANTLRGVMVELMHASDLGFGREKSTFPGVATLKSNEPSSAELVAHYQQIAAATGSWSAESAHAAEQLRTALNTLNLIIAIEGGEMKATTDQLREQVDLTQLLAHLRTDTPVGPVHGPSGTIPQGTNNILGDVARANQAVEAAAALRNLGADDIGALSRANDLRDKAIAKLKEMLRDSIAQNDTTTAGLAGQAEILRLLNELGVATKDVHSNFDAITEGIRGVLDAADGFHGVNDSVRQTVAGALNVVDALNKVRAAQKAATAEGRDSSLLSNIGAGLGFAGAGIQLISGIAGLFQKQHDPAEDAARAAQIQALAANSERLSEVRSALAGSVAGMDKQTDALKLALRIASGGVVQNKSSFESLAPSFGLTADQFEQIVKDSGITLFDDKGAVIQGAFTQFIAYLEASAAAARTLSDSLDDQKTKLDLNARIFGKNSPLDKLQNEYALLAHNLGGSASKLFQGIDATTAAGRAQLEKALQGLVQMIDDNTLTSADFGTFANVHDLINTILGVQDALDGMTTATNAVTGALTNVPSWYKTNLAAFNAAAIGVTSANTPFVPTTISGALGKTTDRGNGSTKVDTPSVTYNFGDVFVDAHATPPEQMFEQILKVAKRRAVNKFGDSTRWADVQA